MLGAILEKVTGSSYAELLEEKFYAKAIEYFKHNTENYPYSPNAFDSLGEAYRENKQYQLACESFQKAVELAEKTSDSRLSVFKDNLESVKSELSPQ